MKTQNLKWFDYSNCSSSFHGVKDDKYVDDINSEFYNLNANDELLKRYYYDNIRTNKGVMCAY